MNNNKTIYVVMGATGEYSDRQEWPVFGFETEKDAQNYVIELQKQYLEITEEIRERYYYELGTDYSEMKTIMSLDPNFIGCHHTNTAYYIMQVEMKSKNSIKENKRKCMNVCEF